MNPARPRTSPVGRNQRIFLQDGQLVAHADNDPNVHVVSIEPQWLRPTKTTPVASLGGMAFANPSLAADPQRPPRFISPPCPWVTEGKGKKCLCPKRRS